MQYKYLLFDLDETLFDFNRSESQALKNAMFDFNIPYNEENHLSIYRAINKQLWQQLEQGSIEQKDIKLKRFETYKEALGLQYETESFAKCFMHHLGEASYLLTYAETLIHRLAPHYRLIALTNGMEAIQKRRMEKSPLAPYFQHVFISETIGISKPNPLIFHHVLNTVNIENRQSCLMIGDSLTSDIQGGIRAGIDTCWVNLYNKKNIHDFTANYEVKSLQDLEALLIP